MYGFGLCRAGRRTGLQPCLAPQVVFNRAFLAFDHMQYKALFRGITLIPLLAPSLLSAISLIYWFGNQGVLKGWMQGLGIEQIYGAPGIVVAECFAVFPHAAKALPEEPPE